MFIVLSHPELFVRLFRLAGTGVLIGDEDVTFPATNELSTSPSTSTRSISSSNE
jgi:hypothetical protein